MDFVGGREMKSKKSLSLKLFNFLLFAILFTAFVSSISAQKKEGNIYLTKEYFLGGGKAAAEWIAIKRPLNPNAPLRSALEWLFEPKLNNEEQKWVFPTTYATKFEGVSLRNGKAIVRFSETDQTSYGIASAWIFFKAIEKTLAQFPEVKRLEVCAVGKTNLDKEYGSKLFKPCK